MTIFVFRKNMSPQFFETLFGRQYFAEFMILKQLHCEILLIWMKIWMKKCGLRKNFLGSFFLDYNEHQRIIWFNPQVQLGPNRPK